MNQINFKAKVGLNYAYTPYDFLNGGEYIKALRQAVYDAGNLFVDKAGNTKGYGVYANGALDGAQPYGTGNVYGKSAYSTMYYTITGTRTIKCSRTGILKYIHGLNVLRINVI